MGHPEFPNTFDGPNTQNFTSNLTAVAVGFIPRYSRHTMFMTEFVGTGIIMSIVTSQLCQQYLNRTVGKGVSWLASCAVNSFVYTITTVMMGTSSAIFNPAVLFGWALLGRTAWSNWIILTLSQLAGCIAGVLCSYSQFSQQLNRVPIPRKDAQGNWLYMQVRYRWIWCKNKASRVWGPPDRPDWKSKPIPKLLGGEHWACPEFDSDDVGVEALPTSAELKANLPFPSDSEAPKADSQKGPVEDIEGIQAEWVQAGWSPEDACLAATPEFQAELRRDQRNKLTCFAETPMFYSPGFIHCWWPHIMAGTTLVHWLSFMTGNATQLTNTNMYLTQPTVANGTPGSNYAFLNAVLLAWLVGLAYFLLTASAGGVTTLQLNPAADLSGRICHALLPIPNKGPSGWGYSWVPTFIPFFGALIGAGLMYMSMWSHMYFPFLPYGDMPHWW